MRVDSYRRASLEARLPRTLMLPNGHGGSHAQPMMSVGPPDHHFNNAVPENASGYYRRANGGAAAASRSAADYHAYEYDYNGAYGNNNYDSHEHGATSAIVPMRQTSMSIPMEPRVAVQVHYDYNNSIDIKVPVTSVLRLSPDSTHKPLKLHFTRNQLQVAMDDQLSVEFPRGIPQEFGHVDKVDTCRLKTFKFSDVHVLLNGRQCELPLKIVSRTQRFLNDMVTPDLSRACLVLFGGKQPTPARVQQLDTDMNKDADLLNLIGAYKNEEELWRNEVRAANQGRTVWYGSSERDPKMVAVNPAGLIHAATARVLGEEKCRKITEYSLDPSGYRTLLLQDAYCGMKWLCDHLFRMCPPQRLDRGMLFYVLPFTAVDKSSRTSTEEDSNNAQRTSSAEDGSASLSEEELDDASDSELVYDDADRFNMSIYSDQEDRKHETHADWGVWLDSLGENSRTRTHVLQVTAVAHISLRMCVHQTSSQDEPRVYCL